MTAKNISPSIDATRAVQHFRWKEMPAEPLIVTPLVDAALITMRELELPARAMLSVLLIE